MRLLRRSDETNLYKAPKGSPKTLIITSGLLIGGCISGFELEMAFRSHKSPRTASYVTEKNCRTENDISELVLDILIN